MDALKGVGHFAFWFMAGYFVFRVVLLMTRNNLKIKLFGPFIPFVLAIIAAVPYLLVTLGVVSHAQIMSGPYNLFLFYGLLNHISPVVWLFSNFHIAVVLTGIVYLVLLLHYIRLVKVTRRKYAQ